MRSTSALAATIFIMPAVMFFNLGAEAQQGAPNQPITKLSQLRPLLKPKPPVMPQREDDVNTAPLLKSNFGKTPSTLNLSGNDNVRLPQPELGAYSPELEARSHRMFPGITQEFERQRWMAEQEQREIANEINRTKPLTFPVDRQ